MNTVNRLGYQPSLDGFRGLAVILVVAGHAGLPYMGYGGVVGVEVFFVLSGFLITRLLLEERTEYGRVDVKAFYLRRAYRLLPALFLLLAVVTVWNGITPTLWTLGYAANVAKYRGVDLGVLGHTWTLAIEEQFYLAWPLLFVLLRSRRAVRVAATVAGVVLLWRRLVDPSAYYGVSRYAGLAVGCWAAATTYRPTRVIYLSGWGLLGLATLFGFPGEGHRLFITVAELGAVIVLFGLVDSRTLTNRGLVRVGRLSYGWYLWHVPLLAVVPAVVGVPLSWLAAEVSYRVWEAPWLRRKPRPSRRSEPSEILERGVGLVSGRRPEP